jgi:hypothetical protein
VASAQGLGNWNAAGGLLTQSGSTTWNELPSRRLIWQLPQSGTKILLLVRGFWTLCSYTGTSLL